MNKFQKTGVDRLLDCTTVAEVSRSREVSCRICRRYNFDLSCNQCYIDQTAEQLICIFAERAKAE